MALESLSSHALPSIVLQGSSDCFSPSLLSVSVLSVEHQVLLPCFHILRLRQQLLQFVICGNVVANC